MIGVDDRGWSLVPLAETDVPGRWRVITAWRSGVAHRLYKRDQGGLEV
jgi:hypothetical protein